MTTERNCFEAKGRGRSLHEAKGCPLVWLSFPRHAGNPGQAGPVRIVNVKTVEVPSEGEPGLVVAVKPGPGTQLKSNDQQVQVFVSKAIEKAKPPPVTSTPLLESENIGYLWIGLAQLPLLLLWLRATQALQEEEPQGSLSVLWVSETRDVFRFRNILVRSCAELGSAPF